MRTSWLLARMSSNKRLMSKTCFTLTCGSRRRRVLLRWPHTELQAHSKIHSTCELRSKTSSEVGPELTVCAPTSSWTAFSPAVLPLASTSVKVSVSFMSRRLGEVMMHSQSGTLLGFFFYALWIVFMPALKRLERSLPGSKRSWWPGSRQASTLQRRGCGRPGWMRRPGGGIGNTLQKLKEGTKWGIKR